MKTILVPAGGSDTDDVTFATAYAAARCFNAHMEFLHIRVAAVDAALHLGHVAFARGPAIADAMTRLRLQSDARCVEARRHVFDFCRKNGIEFRDTPRPDRPTASWHDETGDAMRHLMLRARHNDLVVAARPTTTNGLPEEFVERLLGAGRPIILASDRPPTSLTGTVMVCWKETAEAARTLGAAMPLLEKSSLVIFASVAEPGGEDPATVSDLVQQAAWHGIHARAHIVAADHCTVADALRREAQSCRADLIVMGAYGRPRWREICFGGCSQSMIDFCDRPVFLVQ